jgi:adenylate kinase family enzyme
LIGGAPRVGKTTLAELIFQRKGISFIPGDAVRDALDRTYPHLGAHAGEWEDVPERIFPYLRELVHTVG